SYDAMLPMLATQLTGVTRLSKEPEAAAAQILTSIRERKTACVFEALGEGNGFRVEADGGVAHPPAGELETRIERHGDAVEVQLAAPSCGPGSQWRPWLVGPAPHIGSGS